MLMLVCIAHEDLCRHSPMKVLVDKTFSWCMLLLTTSGTGPGGKICAGITFKLRPVEDEELSDSEVEGLPSATNPS